MRHWGSLHWSCLHPALTAQQLHFKSKGETYWNDRNYMVQLSYGTLILVSELRSGVACVPKFHLNKKHTGVPQRK